MNLHLRHLHLRVLSLQTCRNTGLMSEHPSMELFYEGLAGLEERLMAQNCSSLGAENARLLKEGNPVLIPRRIHLPQQGLSTEIQVEPHLPSVSSWPTCPPIWFSEGTLQGAAYMSPRGDPELWKHPIVAVWVLFRTEPFGMCLTQSCMSGHESGIA